MSFLFLIFSISLQFICTPPSLPLLAHHQYLSIWCIAYSCVSDSASSHSVHFHFLIRSSRTHCAVLVTFWNFHFFSPPQVPHCRERYCREYHALIDKIYIVKELINNLYLWLQMNILELLMATVILQIYVRLQMNTSKHKRGHLQNGSIFIYKRFVFLSFFEYLSNKNGFF